MRLMIATDSYPPDVSGSSVFTERLARGLAERGHDVHVVCASDTGRRTDVVEDGVALHRLWSAPLVIHPRVRFVPPVGVLPALRRLVREVRPDVVHTQDHFTIGRAAMRAAADAGVPVVATNHFLPENLVPYVPPLLRDLVMRVLWWDFTRVYRHAAYLTTPTQTAADVLARRGRVMDAEPVSCGVDLTRFHPRPEPTSVIRKELRLPDLPTIGFVGRLDPEKHLCQLLDAAALTLSRVPAQVVVAGTGVARRDLERQATRLGISGRVHLLGYVPDEDLPWVYGAADVFVMPGVAELQSIATLEAMAAGLPVIAADALALPHLVVPGQNGYLFRPGDVAGLADAIVHVLTSDKVRTDMGMSSRARAEMHDRRASVHRFEEIYAALHSGRRP